MPASDHRFRSRRYERETTPPPFSPNYRAATFVGGRAWVPPLTAANGGVLMVALRWDWSPSDRRPGERIRRGSTKPRGRSEQVEASCGLHSSGIIVLP